MTSVTWAHGGKSSQCHCFSFPASGFYFKKEPALIYIQSSEMNINIWEYYSRNENVLCLPWIDTSSWEAVSVTVPSPQKESVGRGAHSCFHPGGLAKSPSLGMWDVAGWQCYSCFFINSFNWTGVLREQGDSSSLHTCVSLAAPCISWQKLPLLILTQAV